MDEMMEEPKWYRKWCRDAVCQLQCKIASASREFQLCEWPRWDYDLNSRQLFFSKDNMPRVAADIQIAGTASASDWLWSWGNDHLPKDLTADAKVAREFGCKHGVCDLTRPIYQGNDINGFGWEQSAVIARLTGAASVYRPVWDNSAIFFVIRKFTWLSNQSRQNVDG